MKKLSKFLLVVVLALGLAFSVVLTGCTDDTAHTEHVDEDQNGVCDICGENMPSAEPDEAEITDGRWQNETGEVFFKLKEDGTFYMAGMFTYDAGTYELVDEETTYYKIEIGQTPAEGDNQTAYTASQKLVMTAYDGTQYTAAYAEDIFWNCTIPTLAGSMWRTMYQDADYEWDESDEEAIEIVRVSLPKDAYANLVLYHNLTFADQTSGYAEGTWKTTDIGYELFDEDGAAYATLTRVENGICTYTPAGGTAVTLYETAWEPIGMLSGEKDVTFAGETSAESVTFELRLWDDNSADLQMTDSSWQISTILSGTWEVQTDNSISLTLGETQLTISAPDEESNVSVTLAIAAGDVFANDVSVMLSGQSAIVSEVTEIGSFLTEENVTASGIPGVNTASTPVEVVMYSDNTAQLTVNIFNNEVIVDTGTYVIDTSGALPSITFTFDVAGEIAATPDYATATPTGITYDLAYTAENVSVTALGNTFGISFTATMSYAYSIEPVVPEVTEIGSFLTEENVTASGIPGVDTASTPVEVVMYSDNTAQLTVNIFGNEVIVDEGTYVIDTSGQLPTITFTFDVAGEIAATPDYATATSTGITYDLAYTAECVSVTALGNTFNISFTATMHYAYSIN